MDRNVVGLLGCSIMKNLDDFLVNCMNINEQFTGLGNVAVKLHMGEYGNLHYVRPPLVGKIVEVLSALGNSPFLFDTPTLYSGSRGTVEGYIETARRNGFCEHVIGCPIRVSDKSVPVETGGVLGTINLAKDLADADGLVVLSHCKGHPELGFGGALKNLAMGATNKKTKEDLHKKPQPVMVGECTGCGVCTELCPQNAITVVDSKAEFDTDSCFGCGVCIDSCPEKVLEHKTATIEELFAETYIAINNQFNGKPTVYINVLMDITPRCDCFPVGGKDEGFPICPDIGVTTGYDATKIDDASMYLIQNKCGNMLHTIHHTDPLKLVRCVNSKIADNKATSYRIYDYNTKQFLETG
ncbi:MAG: DUF362 domain-containing protein [Candidatus Bathyarchaeia archaeon]|jgi:hypothetical protein